METVVTVRRPYRIRPTVSLGRSSLLEYFVWTQLLVSILGTKLKTGGCREWIQVSEVECSAQAQVAEHFARASEQHQKSDPQSDAKD